MDSPLHTQLLRKSRPRRRILISSDEEENDLPAGRTDESMDHTIHYDYARCNISTFSSTSNMVDSRSGMNGKDVPHKIESTMMLETAKADLSEDVFEQSGCPSQGDAEAASQAVKQAGVLRVDDLEVVITMEGTEDLAWDSEIDHGELDTTGGNDTSTPDFKRGIHQQMEMEEIAWEIKAD